MARCWVNDKTKRVYKGAGFPGRDWTLYQNVDTCPPPESKARPQGPCAKQLASTMAMPGAFVPKCDNTGNFSPVQCHGSVGTCWCADSSGKEVKGSRMSVRHGDVLTPERCAKVKHDQSKQKHGLRLGRGGTCGDGSRRLCMVMIRCASGYQAATFNGCIACVNPQTCLADGAH